MRRVVQFALVLLCFAGSVRASVVLDRIVAIVNTAPIFQSDWELALRTEALMNGRSPESFNSEEQKAVFDRLVDQELLREQMRGFMIAPVSDEDVAKRLQEIQTQIEGAKSDQEWKRLLNQAGITAKEFEMRIRVQMEVLRFLDERFRPTTRVDFREIQAYYREQFLPELEKRGGTEVPLSEVAQQIREILTQQRMDEQITIWMQTLREQADIRIPAADKDTKAAQAE